MALKIAIDARRIRDFGIGTYIRNLINAFKALNATDHFILILSPDEAHAFHELPPNFEVVQYERGDEQLIDNIAFPMFLRRLDVDLVHVPLNRVPVFMPRPYVVTIHDMASLFYEEVSGIRKHFWYYRFRRGLMRASTVIAVSAATSRDVQHQFSIPPHRVRLVYNAPDPHFFRHGPSADARSAGPEAQVRERQRILERYQIHYPFVLYAGNIRPQKNIPRLVEAFAVVRENLADHPRFKDLRLIIIGDEISRYPSVRRAVIQSRVEQAVRFLGFVPFDTLRIFYELAEAFVFPSLYEGFGLPPLEAMASGTPVVASAVASLPEVVGDAAFVVNPENVFDIARGIKEVLLDETLRQQLIEKGKQHAATFSWERTAREVLEIYRSVARHK
jgi:glycosyltransferase involved in cell wall biosynthesis